MRATFFAFFLTALSGIASDHTAFFEAHCVKCHGPEKQKGDFRLDTLGAPDFDTAEDWSLIADVIETGEMPPRKEPRPDAAVATTLVDWISHELGQIVEPTLGLRRMNRVEYENTLHDLLGIDTPLAELLPEDGSVQGFDNVANGLGISSILMERYLEAADAAFEGTIRRIQPLPPATRRANLMEIKDNIESVKKKKGGVIEEAGGFVDFTPGWPPARIDPAHPIEEGVYRCRVAVFPHEPNDHRTLSVAVFAGPLFGDGKRRFMGMFDVTGTPEKPRIIEFTTRMGELHALHILPWIYPEHLTYRDKHEKRPGVGILWAETHGPLDQAFPSEPQKQLFGESETLSMEAGASFYIRHRKGVKSHHVASTAPREDAERIIRDLIPRAFRRPVPDELADQFVDLALAKLDQGNTFEDSVRAGFTAVFCSPHFLLLNRETKVDDYEIASRLSYFLWSSLPDAELMSLAAAGKLSDATVRHAQIERMLNDPKSERLIDNFTGQWLDLRDIEFTTPDKKLFPEFDELLQRSMVAETKGFFRHLLTENLSVLNFIDSDFAVLNQRLATHYGIPGIRGHEEFRIVPLPKESIRGGILTHGSVLKVTANGTSTSPILRGVWVLDNLLGQPALPPPPGVPAVEPDIRGAINIRDQLEKHREDESCARCHARIDPPGFALEQFNAIGGEREWYRSLGGDGGKVRHVSYRIGQTVQKGDVWPDGRKFADFTEFQQQLLDNPDVVAKAIASKLLVYGTGRPLTNADRKIVDAVVDATRKDDFGLRSMIHAVAESELFFRP
tara:strand:- start:32406 stop:34769 length:2364 start_codon:yes stop_codon:yes gene_type:complete